ncbi:DMT family transporter [Janthinobacterium psychrotolerans]|uniref:EamA-like transporter family protein n=1 Tax=Janthinobacterium psychrotolerans TaxID=1747903 RepID=A0A1A7C7I1_9BURK|nr:DMT family transporter [Janthinobacterium psychrotolerans]OBV40979.1 EamA-like transporter family protein [Janthinobacterium psychrotolerans]
MPTTTSLATTLPRLGDDRKGLLLGLIAVTMFSLTLPFTRLAVAELPAIFVALGRALVAAGLAALWLWHQRAAPPHRGQWLPLALVAAGCVIGFPLLTSLAMRSLPAAHGAVLVGILPLATAVFAVLRGKERPSPAFWLMAVTGTALVVAFALRQGGGSFHAADWLMFAAVLLGALGYAEGGRLAQAMPGQQVICWALVLAAPFVLPVVLWHAWPQRTLLAQASVQAWGGFAYISVFSMLIGFFFWYRGMALGGVARVGQTQLLQPFLTLLGAAVLLGEPLASDSLLFAGAVIAVVAAGRKLK